MPGWTRGWRVERVDLRREEVEFVRAEDRGDGGSLYARASALTGVTERKALVDLALQALVQKETAAKLFGLGGTMPDASAPERRRPE